MCEAATCGVYFAESSLQTFCGIWGCWWPPILQAARLLFQGQRAVLVPGAPSFCSLVWGMLRLLRVNLAFRAYDGQKFGWQLFLRLFGGALDSLFYSLFGAGVGRFVFGGLQWARYLACSHFGAFGGALDFPFLQALRGRSLGCAPAFPGGGAVFMHLAGSFCSLLWGMLGLLGLKLALGAHNGQETPFAALFGSFGGDLGPPCCRPFGAGGWAMRLLSRGGGGFGAW